MSVDTHPTAETVHKSVKKKIPNISLGTVYRILKSFVDEKEILEIPSDVSHFDGEIKEHAHFICRKCGSVSDLFDNKTKVRYNKNISAGEIDSYQLNFYGKCNKCLK